MIKRKPFRMRSLLDLAHLVTVCQFRLAPCRGISPDGCEPAHSNFSEHGKGMGQKADDDQHVAACRPCHTYFDANKMDMELARKLFNAARKRTFTLYGVNGWLEKIKYKGRA